MEGVGFSRGSRWSRLELVESGGIGRRRKESGGVDRSRKDSGGVGWSRKESDGVEFSRRSQVEWGAVEWSR